MRLRESGNRFYKSKKRERRKPGDIGKVASSKKWRSSRGGNKNIYFSNALIFQKRKTVLYVTAEQNEAKACNNFYRVEKETKT